MERFNFLRNSMLRLPPGFRFHPTDQELVLHYLRCKAYNCPLPASVIPEFDVCRSDPWDLPGDCERERYFFSPKEAKYPNGNRANRTTVSGYWKSTGMDKPVLATGGRNQNQVVGMKKTLVFYRGKPPCGSKTDWMMHEYCLAKDSLNQGNGGGGADASPTGNWVVCRIFLKKRRNDGPLVVDTLSINSNINLDNGGQGRSIARKSRPILRDFMDSVRNDKRRGQKEAGSNWAAATPTSSSGSSGVTVASSSSHGDDEDSTCSSKGLA